MERFFFILLNLCLINFSFGQPGKITTGFEAGVSHISIRGNEILERLNDPTIGFSVGRFFQYDISGNSSFRTNLSFERKGNVGESILFDDNGNSLGTVKTCSNYNYLTLPLLIKINFWNNPKFFFNTGPFFGYLISQKTVTKGSRFPRHVDDNTCLFKRIDMGITGGCGIIVPLTNKNIFSIEIRNNLGLYNISDKPVYNNENIKTNSLSLLVSYSFNSGKLKENKSAR